MSEEPKKPTPQAMRDTHGYSYIDVNRACTAWLAKRGLLYKFTGEIRADVAQAMARKKEAETAQNESEEIR